MLGPDRHVVGYARRGIENYATEVFIDVEEEPQKAIFCLR